MDEPAVLEAKARIVFKGSFQEGLLGGSWDLVSKVKSTLIGDRIVTLFITQVSKSHDPLSRVQELGFKGLGFTIVTVPLRVI